MRECLADVGSLLCFVRGRTSRGDGLRAERSRVIGFEICSRHVLESQPRY